MKKVEYCLNILYLLPICIKRKENAYTGLFTYVHIMYIVHTFVHILYICPHILESANHVNMLHQPYWFNKQGKIRVAPKFANYCDD